MNHSNTQCWNIILRFCALDDRIQCSYVNKSINTKYKLLAPNINDLISEFKTSDRLEFYKKCIDRDKLKQFYPECNLDEYVLNSFLNRHIRLQTTNSTIVKLL
jgi:hypothetical protein